MTAKPQILGTAKPLALVPATLFTVPPGATAELSIFINNQDINYDGYTISLVPSGQPITVSTRLAYNTQLAGQSTVSFSALYLNSGDEVVVSSTLAFEWHISELLRTAFGYAFVRSHSAIA